MKVLLINNDSDTWTELQDLCERCEWEVKAVHHQEIEVQQLTNFDLIILSGGWWYDDETRLLSEYAAELQLITSAHIPILGICIGMQLMHVALDQAVPLLDKPQSGSHTIQLTDTGQRLLGLPEVIRVFKNHTRAIIELDPEFESLAHSAANIEMMIHCRRSLMGVQFHPESEEDPVRAVQLMKTLVSALLRHRPTPT